MLKKITAASAALMLLAPFAQAGEADIASAMSAAPESLARNATIQSWGGEVLRQGSNSWVCLPDRPDNGGTDPWCVDASWLNLLNALSNGEDPTYDKVGIAYMLAGDAPISNITPAGKKEDGDWVEGLNAHLMVLVPDHSSFDNISTDPDNGGPWIMWPGTPYAHIMIPIDSYPSN